MKLLKEWERKLESLAQVRGEEARRKLQGGGLDSVFALMGEWVYWGVLIAIIIFVLFIGAKVFLGSINYSKDLMLIQTGLGNYASAYGYYPAGTGWSWDVNYAYVPQDIISRGWKYSCNSNTIIITSPAISDAKVRERLKGRMTQLCDKVVENGNTVECYLEEKLCK